MFRPPAFVGGCGRQLLAATSAKSANDRLAQKIKVLFLGAPVRKRNQHLYLSLTCKKTSGDFSIALV